MTVLTIFEYLKPILKTFLVKIRTLSKTLVRQGGNLKLNLHIKMLRLLLSTKFPENFGSLSFLDN